MKWLINYHKFSYAENMVFFTAGNRSMMEDCSSGINRKRKSSQEGLCLDLLQKHFDGI